MAKLILELGKNEFLEDNKVWEKTKNGKELVCILTDEINEIR